MAYSNPGPAIGGTPTTFQDSAGFPDGMYIGNTATSLVGFYGATPITQPQNTLLASVVTTNATTTTPWGFTTSTQANSVVSQLNIISTALQNLGLIAT